MFLHFRVLRFKEWIENYFKFESELDNKDTLDYDLYHMIHINRNEITFNIIIKMLYFFRYHTE